PILRAAASAGIDVTVEPAVTEVDRLPAADPMTGTFAGPPAVRGAIAFQRLVAVMARLRSPDGCPWDRAQTHESLAIHLIEETHEVLDAIDRHDMVDLEEELGDLLLQIVFHAQLASDAGAFEIGDVVEELIAKLVYRHPHIFGDVTVGGADEVVANWESLKHEQKGRTTRADGIPKDLPALLYAHKVQRRISGAGRAGKAAAQHLPALVDAAASAGGPGADSGAGGAAAGRGTAAHPARARPVAAAGATAQPVAAAGASCRPVAAGGAAAGAAAARPARARPGRVPDGPGRPVGRPVRTAL